MQSCQQSFCNWREWRLKFSCIERCLVPRGDDPVCLDSRSGGGGLHLPPCKARQVGGASVADPFIPDPGSEFSIPDPVSRIQGLKDSGSQIQGKKDSRSRIQGQKKFRIKVFLTRKSRNLSRNRNRNLSKVETGTVINSFGSATLLNRRHVFVTPWRRV